MNRGITILSGLVILLVSATALLAAAVRVPPETFDYSEYEEFIARNPGSAVVGPVSGYGDAIKKAVRLWHQEFGDAVYPWRSYKAYDNAEHDVWMVQRKSLEAQEGTILLYRNCYCFIEGGTGKVLALFLMKA